MPELDWETVEIDAIREEDFWDLLTSAAADVQEVALSVWNQSANSDVGFGYASIAELVADPGDTMPMKNRLKFFRRKIQVLRKQAHLLSSRQTSGNETSGHLQHRAFQQRLPTQGPFDSECANNYGGISIYPGSAGDRLGPRSVLDAQSIAFGGRLNPPPLPLVFSISQRARLSDALDRCRGQRVHRIPEQLGGRYLRSVGPQANIRREFAQRAAIRCGHWTR